MYSLFVVIHIVVALILILVVLLQSGKAGDLAGAFGGSGSQTAFGSRSAATLLTKATAVAAALFMVTSFGLSVMSLQGTSSIMEGVPQETGQPPAATQPAETPPAETKPAESEPPAATTQGEGQAQPAATPQQPAEPPQKPPDNQ